MQPIYYLSIHNLFALGLPTTIMRQMIIVTITI
nr:MAG TPA: hypothetical protein [Caudoviricetes sp.]